MASTTCRSSANGYRPSATASRMSWRAFDIARLESEAASLEQRAAEPGFWDDPQAAQDVMKRASALRERIATWRRIETRAADLLQLVDLAEAEGDEATAADVARDADALEREL